MDKLIDIISMLEDNKFQEIELYLTTLTNEEKRYIKDHVVEIMNFARSTEGLLFCIEKIQIRLLEPTDAENNYLESFKNDIRLLGTPSMSIENFNKKYVH